MAGKRATRYSADDYSLSIANLEINSGRGTDTFVEIAAQEDDFGYKSGIDGEGVFYEIPGDYTVVLVYLMQTSAGNALLSALHNASKKAKGIMYPIAGSDSRGTSKIVSEACMIIRMPDEKFAKEPDVTVWAIGVHDPDREIGSH